LEDPAEIVEEEDVDLEEFIDEIDDWIIDELKKIGLDAWKNEVYDLCKRILAVFELDQSIHAPVYLAIFTHLKNSSEGLNSSTNDV
jgi:hypothetical protein